mgnify:CR=1 FL=1
MVKPSYATTSRRAIACAAGYFYRAHVTRTPFVRQPAPRPAVPSRTLLCADQQGAYRPPTPQRSSHRPSPSSGAPTHTQSPTVSYGVLPAGHT